MREAPTRRRAAHVLVAMATAALLAAGCGDGETTASTDDIATPADQSTEGDDTSTDDTDTRADNDITDDAITTTTVADDNTSTDNTAVTDENTSDDGIVIEASVVGGSVEVVATRVEIDIGSTVTIRIDADAADHIHLHGYDVLADVAPGSPAEMIFIADVPGVFEIELEDSGTFLFEIVVS